MKVFGSCFQTGDLDISAWGLPVQFYIKYAQLELKALQDFKLYESSYELGNFTRMPHSSGKFRVRNY
jgi:hypothetical protein